MIQLKEKRYNQHGFLRMMTHCFEPGHYKGLIDEIAFDDVAKPWFKKYDAEWREDLKEGDTIDV